MTGFHYLFRQLAGQRIYQRLWPTRDTANAELTGQGLMLHRAILIHVQHGIAIFELGERRYIQSCEPFGDARLIGRPYPRWPQIGGVCTRCAMPD